MRERCAREDTNERNDTKEEKGGGAPGSFAASAAFAPTFEVRHAGPEEEEEKRNDKKTQSKKKKSNQIQEESQRQ